jgi:nucleoside-diphosphate-sugar epimerase
MKIAVIGATGFIGSHVLQELVKYPDLQIVAVSHRRTIPIDLPTNVSAVSIDMKVPTVNDFELLGKPDCVLHLAWAGLPNYRSLHHYEIELPIQYRFLSGLIRSGLKNLVVAGTCYEYGMQNGELSEAQSALPANAYAFAKNALRQQLEFLQADTNGSFRLAWARLFYTYGARQSPASLYSQLHAALSRGDQSFAMSGGEQLRDFLPVDRVARFLTVFALSPQIQGIVNVCSGTPSSVRALVERWVKDSEQKISLDLGRYPYPDHEPFAFWGSSAKLNRLMENTVLGYTCV